MKLNLGKDSTVNIFSIITNANIVKLKKHIFQFLLFAVLAALVFSCSSSKSRYNSDFPFSNEIAYSSDSSFSVLIPQGWYQIEDNECNCNNILLLRAGLQASLNLVPVSFDFLSSGRIEKNPLKQLVKYSKIMKSQKFGNPLNVKEEEQFEIDEIPVRTYKYLNSKGFEQRVLLFSIEDKFFELSANSATKSKDVLNDLFSAQNSILIHINLYGNSER
jgi:hypothetical protein